MFVAHFENTMRNARHTIIDQAVLNEIIDKTRTAAEVQARRIIDDAQSMAATMIAQAHETVLRILGEAGLENIPSHRPQAMELIRFVAQKHGVRIGDITGVSRNTMMVAIRHEAMALVYSKRPDLSTTQIGRIFSRDHTTILHAVRKLGVFRPLDQRQGPARA